MKTNILHDSFIFKSKYYLDGLFKFMTLSFLERSLLKQFITTNIDSNGKKIYNSLIITDAELELKYKDLFKIKKALLKLQNKSIIEINDDKYYITEYGLNLYAQKRKPGIFVSLVIASLLILVTTIAIYEITTQGIAFNTYRATENGYEYRFYGTNYVLTDLEENAKGTKKRVVVEKGKYSISDDELTLIVDDGSTETKYIYKDALYIHNTDSLAKSTTLKKESEGKYSRTLYDMWGSSGSYLMLEEDGKFGWSLNYGYGSTNDLAGDYKIKDNIIYFDVKYEKDMDGNEKYESYTIYGVLKDDSIYPYAYLRK